MLFVSVDLQRFLSQSRVSAVAFAGYDENARILELREMTGRLPDIIAEIRVFFERNIHHPAREYGFYREDIFLYDSKA